LSAKSPLPVDVLVGHNIRIGRLQMGLSQTELGERVGVTFQQIQKYEKGANRVGASRLQQIADVLRISIPMLFDGAAVAHHPGEVSARSLLAQPHSLRLLQAFDKIKDEATRLAVLRIIENVAGTAARNRSRKRSGG
jgi:transcriptional regulator with XRE-family HTH domain